MKDRCVSFENLCELFDEEIATVEEREAMLTHLEECPDCKEKYQKLKNTMGLLNHLKCQCFELDDMCCNTLTKYRTRKRKKQLFRTLPAIAASFFMVIGLGFIGFGFLSDTRDAVITADNVSTEKNDSEEVINIIRKNDAHILKVTELYIEGEVKRSHFSQLRRDLGFRKVAFSMAGGPAIANNNKNTWRENIEEVGSGADRGIEAPQDSDRKAQFIRFRVFR